MARLPVADPWYRTEHLGGRLWLITEPHVHPIFSANIHLVLGQDRDLIIDSGMGIAPLRPLVDGLRPDLEKPLLCLSTHTHVDHIGAVHEFEERLIHPIEAEELAAPPPWTLRSNDIPSAFVTLFESIGYPVLWPWLVDSLPSPDFVLDDYKLRGARHTGLVADGDAIDLGDWQAEVLHLPGHSPGQVGLFHHDSGTLFGADAVYDGPLVFGGPGMSTEDYARTLQRIASMPVKIVYGGHDPAFGKARLDEIIEEYLRLWAA